MFKFLATLFFSFFAITTSANVTYEWETGPDFNSCKEVFFLGFSTNYNQIPPEALFKADRAAVNVWLTEVFDNEYRHFIMGNHRRRWLTAKKEGRPIGMLLLDFENYPKEVYLAQMSVHPDHQRQKIGTTLIATVLKDFPEIEKLVTITRKANSVATEFWHAIGFVDSPFMHPKYNPDIYTGYEFYNQR
ncbi:MAG: GNAT family N-acetyltransferase [Verrucomicrobia bacterium]|nr:GNAT family N-acetyltransferase [Verrucomicrobiota bacterium]